MFLLCVRAKHQPTFRRGWQPNQRALTTLLAVSAMPTGAGDCFTAAYMVATLEGRSTADAMRFAAAAASMCVSRPGAMTSLPTRAELNDLLSSLS